MTRVIIELIPGNINNSHLYLSSVIDFFPNEYIGGPNKGARALQEVEVHTGVHAPVKTDITGDKKYFGNAWTGDFFKAHDLKAGDRVVIQKTAPYRFNVSPRFHDEIKSVSGNSQAFKEGAEVLPV